MSSTVEAVKTAVSNKTVLIRRAAIVTGVAVAFGVGLLVQKARTSDTTVLVEGDLNVDTNPEANTNL